jgi:hypothetical protein
MKRLVAAVGWLVFAALIVLGGRMALDACEIRPWPVFGYAFCPRAPQRDPELDTEQERARALRLRLRSAERRLASLPICQSAQQQPVEAAPPPGPPKAEAPQQEDLKIPASLADLQGCWQSDRGDIEIVTDDEQQRHKGVVRTCYCFDDHGHGRITERYKDGENCSGRLKVTLNSDQLKIDHDRLSCSGNKGYLVPEAIDCKGTAGQAATCSNYELGYLRHRTDDQTFHKVPPEACEWNN